MIKEIDFILRIKYGHIFHDVDSYQIMFKML